MKKVELLNNLLDYASITTKTTRKDFINIMVQRADAILSDSDNIDNKLTMAKDGYHYGLGGVAEILIKKILGLKTEYNGKKIVLEIDPEKTPGQLKKDGTPVALNKLGHPCRFDMDRAVYKEVVKNCTSYITTPDKVFDLLYNDKKIEVKFATSDALATPLNNAKSVDKVIVIALTKKFRGVFVIPPQEVRVNSQNKVEWNQPAKYFNQELTTKMFGVGY